MSAKHEISQSTPSAGEAGRTGDWRTSRPVVEASTCMAAKAGKPTCQICWVYCPDACIAQGTPPSVDLEYCKGCGICAEVCPSGSISMTPESETATCAAEDER